MYDTLRSVIYVCVCVCVRVCIGMCRCVSPFVEYLGPTTPPSFQTRLTPLRLLLGVICRGGWGSTHPFAPFDPVLVHYK